MRTNRLENGLRKDVNQVIEREELSVEDHLNRLMTRVINDKENTGIVWRCNECAFTLKSKRNMISHVEIKHANLKFRCNHCHHETKTNRALSKHMQKKHDIKLKIKKVLENNDVVLCDDCGEKFNLINRKEKKMYERHMAKHQTEKASCKCKVDFATKAEKYIHMKVVHESYIKCDQCSEVFKTAEGLERHQYVHESIPCSKCGVIYNGQITLRAHMLRAHDEIECICEIFSKVLKNRVFLTKHKREKHELKACKICFKKVSHMREHMLALHTVDREKPYQCDKCDKGFIGSQQLRNHQVSVHLKSRPYKCRYECGMDYNDPSNMSQHEKRKHGGLFKEKLETE